MPEEHSVVREGIVAGVIGATAVAIFFLIADTIAGQPLATPKVLGETLFSFFGPTAGDSAATHIIFYTIFHYAAFILVGLFATWVVHRAATAPTLLAVFLLLFVIVELGFYGLSAIIAHAVMFQLGWYRVLAGNIIAVVLMGTFLWRRHPSLGHEFDMALDGQEH